MKIRPNSEKNKHLICIITDDIKSFNTIYYNRYNVTNVGKMVLITIRKPQ